MYAVTVAKGMATGGIGKMPMDGREKGRLTKGVVVHNNV